jgi:hypothetical protein
MSKKQICEKKGISTLYMVLLSYFAGFSQLRPGLTIPDWFRPVLVKRVINDDLARRMPYIALWNRTFVSYPGHSATPDFLTFYRDPPALLTGIIPVFTMY